MESSGSINSSVTPCQILIQLLSWNDSRFTPACQTTICHHICEILLWLSARKLYKKPEELQESLYNKRGAKGSPRILSKNILLYPSMHMWKKCLWNNCSLQNISTHKCWNYLSTRKRSICSCCRSLFWSVGKLRASLPPPPLLNLARREKTEPWPFCLLLALQSPVHPLQSF